MKKKMILNKIIESMYIAFATIPLATKRLPGMPSLLQSFAFGGIFAGAG